MNRDDFNKNSLNAVLARMEERQKNDSEHLKCILELVEKQGDRITSLEHGKIWIIGAAAGVAFCARMLWEWITTGPKH
ncbi:MAG: hypothetical protein JWM68_232 [Verrucomicrobiales bacterium]|nr:hypothetical protein [Verrucomicrobiales bacterium]